jgi:uncharacterized protein (TIGR02145 family)
MKNVFLLITVIVGFVSVMVISSCNKEEVKPTILIDSVVDIDGNVYKTIKIGKTWWMAENLRVTKFNNGTKLIHVTDKNDIDFPWQTLTKPAFCSYAFKQDTIGLGYLYNWHVITDTNSIAPQGWRIATDEDWKQLEAYLGMSKTELDVTGWRGENVGDKMKAVGVTYWFPSTDKYNVWGEDAVGFKAMAGGCRLHNGKWGNPGIGYTGMWWTSTKTSDTTALYRYLDYKQSKVFRAYAPLNYGMSIRCVKDDK